MLKSAFTHEEFLLMLNFTTRLLALDLNEEPLFERALEALSDFSANRTAALLTSGQEEGTLCLEGLFAERHFRRIKRRVSSAGTPLEKVIQEKQYGLYPARIEQGAPLPVWEGQDATTNCLCLPLAGSSATILGVLTIEQPAVPCCRVDDLQMLILLSTMSAISLENARLFKLATEDGLTGLHVRAVFDMRLREELVRRNRYGADLSILLADIDHFKDVNDSQGHRGGDLILRGDCRPDSTWSAWGDRRGLPLRRGRIHHPDDRHRPRSGPGRGGADPPEVRRTDPLRGGRNCPRSR